MRQIRMNPMFTLLVLATPILIGVLWGAARSLRPAQAQGLSAVDELPLTTVYFYGPISVSAGQLLKMCGSNFFGDRPVRVNAAFIDAADGSVLVARQLGLPRRAGACMEYRSAELGPVEVVGLLWTAGSSSGSMIAWNPARAAPLASTQLLDPTTGGVIAIINSPGKVTVDTDLLPAVPR